MRRKAASMLLAGMVFSTVFAAGIPPQPGQQVDPFYTGLFEEGKQLWLLGSYKEAIENLEIAYFGFLNSPELLLEASIYLMVCYFESGNNERAALYEAKVAELDTKGLMAGLDLPGALLEKYHEANAYFARRRLAGQRDPSSGQKSLQLINPEAAISPRKSPFSRIAELEQLIDRDKKNLAAYLEIASLYLEYGNPKRAKPVLKKLLKLAPDHAVGRFLLGKVHMALEDFQDASAEFAKAAPALDGDIEFHYQKGITHFELRDYEGARKEFGRVQSINPGYKLTEKYLEEIARKFEPAPIPAKPTNIRLACLRE